MIRLKTWESIRLRCRRDGEHIKAVARDEGISPNTVRKYLRSDEPPRSKPRERTHILDPFQSHIDELLRRSPRITAVRIGSYLRQNVDASIRCDESTLRKYVARRRELLIPKEAFVRACYAPGDEAQFDFSPVEVYLAGVLTVVQLFAIRLSYSGRHFARASLRSDQISLFTGLLAGFVVLGGLPLRAIFDNAKTAVIRVLRGRSRVENTKFTEFCGALALEINFAAPAKGNEKGGVEGIIGYLQDNFFRPVPSFATLAELNAALAAFCEGDVQRLHATHRETIAARFEREQPACECCRRCSQSPVCNGMPGSTSSPRSSSRTTSIPYRVVSLTASSWSRCTRSASGSSSMLRRSPSIHEALAAASTSSTRGITLNSCLASTALLNTHWSSPTDASRLLCTSSWHATRRLIAQRQPDAGPRFSCIWPSTPPRLSRKP